MRFAFVSFYQAYPPHSGASSVTYNAAKHAEGESFLIQLASESRSECTVDGLRVITLAGASDNRWRKIGGLAARIRRITDAVCGVSPDVVVLEGASWVVYHWLLLRQLRRRLPRAEVVYHSHNVEYCLRKQKHGRLVTAITRWAEGGILREADASFAVSDVDSAQFEELYGVRPAILPNGVDIGKFDRVTDAEIDDARSEYGLNGSTVLFMGSYLYKPNREGLDFLIGAVMPRVVEQCPSATLAVIGGEVPFDEPWLINPGMIPHDRLPAFVKACRVGVAPIFSGSGTRLKIIEYMAAGRAVVSTSKGAEGLSVEDGKQILFAEEEDDFAKAIVKTLSDESLAGQLGNAGHAVVGELYSWPPVMRRFEKILGR